VPSAGTEGEGEPAGGEAAEFGMVVVAERPRQVEPVGGRPDRLDEAARRRRAFGPAGKRGRLGLLVAPGQAEGEAQVGRTIAEDRWSSATRREENSLVKPLEVEVRSVV
jgi:hypothetical protein